MSTKELTLLVTSLLTWAGFTNVHTFERWENDGVIHVGWGESTEGSPDHLLVSGNDNPLFTPAITWWCEATQDYLTVQV